MALCTLQGEEGEGRGDLLGRTSPCDCNSQRASRVHCCTPMHERLTSIPLKDSSSDILRLGVGGWLGGVLAMPFCVEKGV